MMIQRTSPFSGMDGHDMNSITAEQLADTLIGIGVYLHECAPGDLLKAVILERSEAIGAIDRAVQADSALQDADDEDEAEPGDDEDIPL